MPYKKIPHTLFLMVLFVFIHKPAYAYLDPGSGNALIYLVISLFGTLAYFTKNVYYKLIGRSKIEKNNFANVTENHEKILLFSEGKTYWFTFKPIIEAFIEKKIPFSYVSMDICDPALTIDNPYMLSKYIGSGSAAFAKVAQKRALVMLATTPNIGTPNFPMPRPKHVSCLAHVCHGVGDLAMYHKGSLDHYDAVLMTGDQIEQSVRTLENMRNLAPKECISLGLPYFDELAKTVVKNTSTSQKTTILLAPSWGDKSCINLCGTQFIHDMAQAAYRVIIRPHPHSFKVEMDKLLQLKKEFSPYENVSFDENIDPSSSFQQADLLISDKSGVRFDFALLYERPVITIDAPVKDIEQYEYADLQRCWEDTIQAELGAVLFPTGHINIVPIIEKTLAMPAAHFANFRAKHIANFTTSGNAIATWTVAKINSNTAHN